MINKDTEISKLKNEINILKINYEQCETNMDAIRKENSNLKVLLEYIIRTK